MRRVARLVCLLMVALGLFMPRSGAALTKDEVRERSLKRLERVSEKVKGQPQGEDGSGVSLGRFFPSAGEEKVPAAVSPTPAPAKAPASGRTTTPGRAAERRTDEAVILDASSPHAAPPAAQAAQHVQDAQPAPVSPPAQVTPQPMAQAPAQAPAQTAAKPPAVGPDERNKALEFFRQALAAADKDNHKKALELLNKAVALDPTDPDIFNNRGNAYNNLDEPRKALADYDTAMSMRPGDAAAHSNRGLAYERLGDDKAACSDYKAACDLGDCEFYESFRKEGRCSR